MESHLWAWVTAAVSVLVAVQAARYAIRRRDRMTGAIAASVGLLSVVSILGRVQEVLGHPHRPMMVASALAFAGSGFALLIARDAILPLGGRVRMVAGVAVAMSAASAVWLGLPLRGSIALSAAQRAGLLLLIGVWVGCALEPAIRFWAVSRSCPPVTRARLRLLSVSFVALPAVLLVVVVIGFAVHHGRPPRVPTAVVAALLPGLYLGVTPPSALQRRWLRRAAERQALSIATLGAWYWDREHQRVWWSPEFEAVLGLVSSPGPQPTMDECLKALHPNDRDRVGQALERAMVSGAPFEAEYRVRTADGLRWVHSRAQVVGDPGRNEPMGMFGTVQDVTAYRRSEDALRAALEREREAAERLRQLDATKDALLAAVSHELRTPLTVVLGIAHVLLRPDMVGSEGRAGHLLGRLEVNALRLERLLLDLLDLDRLNRGVVEPHRRLTSVREVVSRVLRTMELRARDVAVEIEDASIYLDAAQVERIVENLVTNALKHTEVGTPVWVRAWRHDGGVVVAVEDAGPGIPDDLKEKIFEPFRRGPTDGGGTGVGLSLVARFAELHGGRAWAEDRRGGGASFRVYLPDDRPELEITTPGHREAAGR